MAPHGLIGQSYDRDGMAIDGKQDLYAAEVIHTSAMAEGAIEGTASEYKLASKFDTNFAYSRFNAPRAVPRDVSQLLGAKRRVGPSFQPQQPSAFSDGPARATSQPQQLSAFSDGVNLEMLLVEETGLDGRQLRDCVDVPSSPPSPPSSPAPPCPPPSPSSPPEPPSPPLPPNGGYPYLPPPPTIPGQTQLPALSFSFTVPGNAEDFGPSDLESINEQLADSVGVPVGSVHTEVQPGSVRLESNITFAPGPDGEVEVQAAENVLDNMDSTQLGKLLKLTVESKEPTHRVPISVNTPSPPAPPPPPARPPWRPQRPSYPPLAPGQMTKQAFWFGFGLPKGNNAIKLSELTHPTALTLLDDYLPYLQLAILNFCGLTINNTWHVYDREKVGIMITSTDVNPYFGSVNAKPGKSFVGVLRVSTDTETVLRVGRSMLDMFSTPSRASEVLNFPIGVVFPVTSVCCAEWVAVHGACHTHRVQECRLIRINAIYLSRAHGSPEQVSFGIFPCHTAPAPNTITECPPATPLPHRTQPR